MGWNDKIKNEVIIGGNDHGVNWLATLRTGGIWDVDSGFFFYVAPWYIQVLYIYDMMSERKQHKKSNTS